MSGLLVMTARDSKVVPALKAVRIDKSVVSWISNAQQEQRVPLMCTRSTRLSERPLCGALADYAMCQSAVFNMHAGMKDSIDLHTHL